MNKKWKEKWIAALRSGKYKQGHGALKKNNNYCCLGVLCDIYPETELLDKDVPYLGERFRWKNEVMRGKLSPGLRDALNISASHQNSLIMQNDSMTPFNEIADYIEREL
jgi:hypothetical protein